MNEPAILGMRTFLVSAPELWRLTHVRFFASLPPENKNICNKNYQTCPTKGKVMILYIDKLQKQQKFAGR